jgi:hypothetical protein
MSSDSGHFEEDYEVTEVCLSLIHLLFVMQTIIDKAETGFDVCAPHSSTVLNLCD